MPSLCWAFTYPFLDFYLLRWLTFLYPYERITLLRGTPLNNRKEEGMPSSKGFKMFLRKEKLTEDEWFEMIEARREMIKPHLNSFSLQELGRLKCLDGDNGQ